MAADILDDFWIYLEGVEVVINGTSRDEIEKFRLGKEPHLEFEKSSDSMDGSRAIKVYGVTKKFLGKNRVLLGFLPSPQYTSTFLSGLQIYFPYERFFRKDPGDICPCKTLGRDKQAGLYQFQDHRAGQEPYSVRGEKDPLG